MNSLHTKERQRIAKMVQQKQSGFIGRNAKLYYFLIWGLYPVAALYSAFTAGSALYVYIARTINHVTAALIITVLVALVIELAKYFFGSAVSDDMRANVLAEDKEYKTAFVLKLVAAIGIFAVSITLSITGAPDVAEEYRESRSPVEASLVNLDEIEKRYDERIAKERSDIAQAEKMTWKGVVVSDGRKIIKQAKSNIAQIEKQRAEALHAAREKNATVVEEYNAETVTAGGWFIGFAGVGEAISIIILLFVGNYMAGAEKEMTSHNGGATAMPHNGNHHGAGATANGYLTVEQVKAIAAAVNGGRYNGNEPQRQPLQQPKSPEPQRPNEEPPQRRIGFNIGRSTTPNVNAGGDGKGKVPTGSCAHCGATYQKTVWNKKYCSEECKLDFHAAKHGGRRFSPNMK